MNTGILRPEGIVEYEILDGSARPAANVLSNLFSPSPTPSADPFARTPRPSAPGSVALAAPPAVAPSRPAATLRPQPVAPTSVQTAGASSAEILKLRHEIRRLELLVKKLQAELEAQHQYAAALEAHIKTLQEGE